jgi:predicted enzyme related to lactoylglutathione lyase
LVLDAQTERKETAMATVRVANAQLWVLDQDEALEFWTQKIGWEVRADITMPELGDFRWLSVGPSGQEDISVVLMAIPGAPVMDDAAKKQLEELVAKGWAGTVFLTADDVQATYEELKDRGVEFTEAPAEQPYGIDSEFRDPSGNKFRLGKPTV